MPLKHVCQIIRKSVFCSEKKKYKKIPMKYLPNNNSSNIQASQCQSEIVYKSDGEVITHINSRTQNKQCTGSIWMHQCVSGQKVSITKAKSGKHSAAAIFDILLQMQIRRLLTLYQFITVVKQARRLPMLMLEQISIEH